MEHHKFNVTSEKSRLLEKKMEELGIKESDIVERFVHSGGHGGQNVNKRYTCVYLKHIPTGIEVKCQKERSQSLNRFFARRILVEKIEDLIRGREGELQQKIEKIRRQKRKRSKRAKEKMLDEKKKESTKKKRRRYVIPPDDICDVL